MVNTGAPPGKGRNFRLTPLELLIILLAILAMIFLAASWNSGGENARSAAEPAAAPSLAEQTLSENSGQEMAALRQELEGWRRESSQTEEQILNRLEALEKRLDSLSLPANETAVLPSPQPDSNEYVVRSGDSLGQIAEKFHVPLASLRQWNNIGPRGEIRAGQRLRLSGS
jgi:LysM repeat protein